LLALARRCKSIPDEVRAIGRLAMAALILDQRSRWGELKAQLEDAIKTAREIRLQYWVVQNFETLGGFALSIGDVATAFDWFQQALNAISADVYEAEFFKARIYCGIAECMVKLAKPARAVEFADLAVTTAEKTGSPHLIAICRLCKSKITACAGDTSEALRLAMGVQVRAAREGWKFEEFCAQKVLLNCLHNLDRSSEAYESAMRALSLAEELSLEEEVVVHLVEVGNVCLKLGLRSDGNKYFQRAAELATKLGRYELVSRARLAMANIGSK
jgi:tetratricopeptide (TPR) repeat protein